MFWLLFLFFILFSVVVIIIVEVGWIRIFIVKLDKVRFKNNFFILLGIDEVFYNMYRMRVFLSIVKGEMSRFSIIIYREKVGCDLMILVSCFNFLL